MTETTFREDGARWREAHEEFVYAERRLARRLNGAGIKPVALMVLWHLDGQGKVPHKYLRAQLALSKASTTEIIALLQRKGLVVQEKPAPREDQRTRLVSITDKGREVLRAAHDG
jgi:DNA-binding MarR family transcriptional regulator